MSALRAVAWIATGVLAMALLTQPVSVQAQLSLSITIIAALLLLWRYGRSPFARHAYLALSGFIVIRYLYWRLTCTLPPASDPFGLSFGLILLTAELYCVAILAISLVVNIDPIKRAPLSRRAEEDLPTVDVFIPTYNEDEYILATTAAAALSLDYPKEKLTVWLLDDGGTDQKCNDKNPLKAEAAKLRRASLQELCKRLGARYLTRARNDHAKAGNMNSALAHVKGDIVVVFDADHAPFRNFLQETVAYFIDDPKLFLVQTPHVFLNPDPIEKNLRTFDRMPSENEMFYSMTQRGLDKWDASFFCGSAALLRRSALMEAGGFSGVTITEDCETAFELHAKGYSSVFVDKPLIAGLQPETFTSFIGQRVRWCQGMLQIMLLKNPVFKKGLRPIQKLGYLSSMTFWFFPFPRLVFMLAPLVYILFDIKLFVSNVDEAVAFTATYMISNVMLQNYLFGYVRWPWISELYEYCQGVFLSKAIVSVILNPHKPTFNVTAKGVTLENDHLSELARPFFIIYLLLLAGSLVAAFRYVFEPGVSHLMFIVGLWNTFNLIMAGVALGVVSERKQRDRHPRLTIKRKGWLVFGAQRVAVEIINVSVGGCGVRLLEEMPPMLLEHEDTRMRLVVETIGGIVGERSLRLIFRRAPTTLGGAEFFGCEFDTMQSEEYVVLADLMYGDPEALPRFLQSRRKHKSLWTGTGQFIWWGVVEPIRAFAYLRKTRANGKSKVETPPVLPPIASTAWLSRLVRQAVEGETKLKEEEAIAPARKSA
ncbi:UDP-forming cellulose synthase catalytic subunit [Methylocystis sp. MJC1]|jgi:cellulose synthase (UDP-forming)|uniref:UDP-forming cellulose synthase catalytic subunit n=1 Tax=Methylocystis sp. MJC1 TaxID=2654282 RepID=UPI0013EBA052|nr:UDP-forming cellulose synthase catalytic subunit [Methylocystis sp. MJC1]MBU6525611.1 UDP-forming cellulose synthase catalytic subunit [Methylocystis sp. MJC1]UZX12086.1 UDP-forming cellulose synthase catalytic subunit [Methylocystis sp. MJC1]